jgi:hypothetical protein
MSQTVSESEKEFLYGFCLESLSKLPSSDEVGSISQINPFLSKKKKKKRKKKKKLPCSFSVVQFPEQIKLAHP